MPWGYRVPSHYLDVGDVAQPTISVCDLFEVGCRGWHFTPRLARRLARRGVSVVWPLRGLRPK